MTDTSKTATSTQIQGNGSTVPCQGKCRVLVVVDEASYIPEEVWDSLERYFINPKRLKVHTTKGGAGPNALRK